MGVDVNGWPNPDKLGYPLNPEIDGWHWLQNTKDNLWPWKWYAKTCMWGFPDPDVDADHMKRAKYHGPALTPAEVAEVVETIEEAAAQAMNAILTAIQTEGETKH